jgi:hypothetical protein
MEYQKANRLSDFNEENFKQFASRVCDRWSFTLPPEEIQNLDTLLPSHVLSVENIKTGLGEEILVGKLIKKRD